MNSLEWIEKELEAYNQLKERAILRIADEDDEIELYMLQRRIDMLTERIPILQQIKNELEAWEVVKEKFFIDIIERDNDCKIGFEPKTPIINGTVTRFAQLDNYKGTIIKKALGGKR